MAGDDADPQPAPTAPATPAARTGLAAAPLIAGLCVAVVGTTAAWATRRAGIGSLPNGQPLAACLAGVLCGGAALAARRMLRSDATRLWSLSAFVGAAVLGASLTASARYGPSQLNRAAEALHLPGTILKERRTGNARCAPTCTTLERRVRLDDTDRETAGLNVLGAARTAGMTFRRAARGQQPDTIYLVHATIPRIALAYGIQKPLAPGDKIEVVYRFVAR